MRNTGHRTRYFFSACGYLFAEHFFCFADNQSAGAWFDCDTGKNDSLWKMSNNLYGILVFFFFLVRKSKFLSYEDTNANNLPADRRRKNKKNNWKRKPKIVYHIDIQFVFSLTLSNDWKNISLVIYYNQVRRSSLMLKLNALYTKLSQTNKAVRFRWIFGKQTDSTNNGKRTRISHETIIESDVGCDTIVDCFSKQIKAGFICKPSAVVEMPMIFQFH